MKFNRACLTGAMLATVASLAQAAPIGIVDPAGDILPTYAGNPATSGDLDVLSAFATYNPGNNNFTLSARMNGSIGATAGGFYVWGVNRGGAGPNATFAANGINNVLFNSAILLQQNGTGSIGGNALPLGSVTILGDVITAIVNASLLPSTGFTSDKYTWNIWPRNGNAGTGFAQITDFAPNNSNFASELVVAAPPSLAIVALGLGLLAWRRRQC